MYMHMMAQRAKYLSPSRAKASAKATSKRAGDAADKE